MPLTRKVGNVVTYVCALLGCGALVAPTMPLRGWVSLFAFGFMGAILITDRAFLHRRSRTLLGVYLLVSGVSFGLPKIWLRHPTWVDVFTDWAFIGAILVMVVAALLERVRRPAPIH